MFCLQGARDRLYCRETDRVGQANHTMFGNEDSSIKTAGALWFGCSVPSRMLCEPTSSGTGGV